MGDQKTNGFFQLKPIVHDWIGKLLLRPQVLFDLLENYGSPLNIHSLIPFHENRKLFEAVFTHYEMDYQIFYARKANKCLQFLKPAKDGMMGIDTASFQELKDGLEMGISSKNLVLTAAIKPFSLMKLAVENEVLVILDNWDEVELLRKAANGVEKTVKFGLRLGGFTFQVGNLRTRFGFLPSKAVEVILKILEDGKDSNICFGGFHFHLNGHNRDHRIQAIKETLVLVDKLEEMGVGTKFIDLGGGDIGQLPGVRSSMAGISRRIKKCCIG